MKKKHDTVAVDEKRYQILSEEVAAWKGKYLRALADYQNLEKRVASQVRDMRMQAGADVIVRLLDIRDTLEKAAASIKDTGVEMVLRDMDRMLKDFGVLRMDVSGMVFDPASMECVSVVDGSPDVVMRELAPGYVMNGKTLRVAKVEVGQRPGEGHPEGTI